MHSRRIRDARLPLAAAGMSLLVSAALLRAGEPGWLLYRLMFAAYVVVCFACLLTLWRTARARHRRREAGLCPACGAVPGDPSRRV